jgi:hypothetical protein
MFTIEIYYTTGDSFNTYSEVEKIGAAFPTLELAQKALKSIEEHYSFVKQVENDRKYHHVMGKEEYMKSKVDELYSKDWYATFMFEEDRKDFEEIYGDADKKDLYYAILNSSHWHGYLNVDCGDEVKTIRAFWIGYFEHPHAAKIVVDGVPNEFEFSSSYGY